MPPTTACFSITGTPVSHYWERIFSYVYNPVAIVVMVFPQLVVKNLWTFEPAVRVSSSRGPGLATSSWRSLVSGLFNVSGSGSTSLPWSLPGSPGRSEAHRTHPGAAGDSAGVKSGESDQLDD